MDDLVGRAAFSEDKHPRAASGTATGGQFAPLGYDDKKKTGTGYSAKGGDSRVKKLQGALNRLGLKDSEGDPLDVDGKLGPRTTEAIKAAQRRLGLKPDGKVTPALLEALTKAKSLPGKKSMSRTQDDLLAPPDPQMFHRVWALDDIEIVSRAKGGDGRTVDAYCAVFNVEQEIHDQHGDYREKNAPTAFNRTLSHGIDRVGVYYHHAMTLHGTPSDLGSVPIARALEAKPDGRGLLTRARYNKGSLADSVLESIRNGEIRGYSYRGKIFRSDPQRIPRARRGQELPLVTRLELGLIEFGPTPTPYYEDAEIMAVRAADALTNLPDDRRRELIRILSVATPLAVPAAPATPESTGLGAEDPHNVHSVRLQRRLRLRSEAKFLGVHQ